MFIGVLQACENRIGLSTTVHPIVFKSQNTTKVTSSKPNYVDLPWDDLEDILRQWNTSSVRKVNN